MQDFCIFPVAKTNSFFIFHAVRPSPRAERHSVRSREVIKNFLNSFLFCVPFTIQKIHTFFVSYIYIVML